jgi:hypothetical protein
VFENAAMAGVIGILENDHEHAISQHDYDGRDQKDLGHFTQVIAA